jgi:hypothetical protein
VPELLRAQRLGPDVLKNNIGPLSYHSGLQTILTPHTPSGHIYHTILQIGQQDSLLPSQFLSDLLEYVRRPLSLLMLNAVVILWAMGGVSTTMDDGSKTCLPPSVRSGRYFVVIESYWRPDSGSQGKIAAKEWAHGAFALLRTQQTTVMTHAPDEVNASSPLSEERRDGADAVCSSVEAALVSRNSNGNFSGYSATLYSRLRTVKTKYDPDNIFRQNTNIEPFPDIDATTSSRAEAKV